MEDTRKKLNLILDLKNNTTIDVKTLCIIQHNSWSSSISRYTSGESRYITMNFISSVVFESLNIMENSNRHQFHSTYTGEEGMNNDFEILEKYTGEDYRLFIELFIKLPEALRTLTVTYSNDVYIVKHINEIIDFIVNISEDKKKYSGWRGKYNKFKLINNIINNPKNTTKCDTYNLEVD